MAGKTLLKARPEPLDLRDRRNYPTYLAGIAVEIAAVLALVAVGLALSFLGYYLWR